MAESMHEKMRRLHGADGEMKPGHSKGSMKNMKKASFEVALKDKKQIAESTFAFTFEKPKDFTFRAGQHIRMTLINPPETDDEGDSRFFSIASTPEDKDLVVAMRMRDTAFKRVLRRLRTGDKVLIQILLGVPHGAFALHDDASKPAVYIAGGIGIVPAYSMIKDWAQRKLPHKMYLFYSNRRPEDAPFLDELQQLAKQNSNFTFVPTMTAADKSAKAWKGETGFIDQAMIKRHIKNLQEPIYYVAGLPEMAHAMKTMLKNLGVKTENVKSEEFTGFNLNEIADSTRPQPKRLMPFAIAALILAAVVPAVFIHAAGTKSVLGSLSFTNPLLYLVIGLFLVVVGLKLKLLLALRRNKGKKSMLELHGLARKKNK